MYLGINLLKVGFLDQNIGKWMWYFSSYYQLPFYRDYTILHTVHFHTHMLEFVLGFSVLFPWFFCLFMCQFYTILMIEAFKNNIWYDYPLFFFLEFASYVCLSTFPSECYNFSYSSEKSLYFYWDHIEFINLLRENCRFSAFYPQT